MRFAALFATLLIVLSGCVTGGGGGSGGSASSFEDAVRAHIEAFIAGDVDAVMAFIADSWVDLGGGDGSYSWAEHRQGLADFFASPAYTDRIQGRSLEQLLKMHEARYLSYEEYREDPQYGFGVPEKFQPRDEDMLGWIPPTEGSGLHDGWFGYYRPVRGGWLMVAGD